LIQCKNKTYQDEDSKEHGKRMNLTVIGYAELDWIASWQDPVAGFWINIQILISWM